jgi:hypothetical protein
MSVEIRLRTRQISAFLKNARVYDLFPTSQQDYISDGGEFGRSAFTFGGRSHPPASGRKMRRSHTLRSVFSILGALILSSTLLCSTLVAQAAPAGDNTIPVPTDWSHSHVIFSRPSTMEQAARIEKDPRYWQQRYRSELPIISPKADTRDTFQGLSSSAKAPHPAVKRSREGDWQENLGAGASIGATNYPAKFSFLLSTANCASAPQPDFVIYGTGLQGASNQASIVAYDNIYSGCTGTVPLTYWAYNTSGQILTSPSYSGDGTQVAFVQTNGALEGNLVLLKWAASTSQSAGTPGTPSAVSLASYPGCTAPCMATILLTNHSGTPADDTTSSLFYDYAHDIAWVGDSHGWLHKFTPLFKGIPAEVRTGVWPVQVNSGNPLSEPVYDSASGNVFVGDAGGYLYLVTSTGGVTQSGQLDFGAGIVQGPFIDSTAGLVYVFASSDHTGTCTSGANCAAVYQLSDNFAAGSRGSEVQVGTAGTTPNPMYLGAFDTTYRNSANATGNLYVCGNTGGAPTLYQVPIAGGVLPASGIPIAQLTSTSNTPKCSPVTNLYNANASGGATEKIFVSVENNGANTACAGGGCVFNFVDTAWQPSTAYNVGQEVLALSNNDGKPYIYVVTVAGTSGATPPARPNTAGATNADGTVVWIDQGRLTGLALQVWTAGKLYAAPDPRIVDSNGNVEVVSTAGTTGSTPPVWSAIPGDTTTDGGVTWVNAGILGSFVLPSAGGASGIVIDNTVGSGTLAGASQIYFSTLTDQICATSGTSGGCAVQASQSALQ